MNEKTHDEHSSEFLAGLTDRELIGMMLRSVQDLRRTNDMGQGAIDESFRLLNIADKISSARLAGD